MTKDEFNKGSVAAPASTGTHDTEIYTVKIEAYTIERDEASQKDYIQIGMVDNKGTKISARQYLNTKEDGSYKKWIYPGDGSDILPSVSYEIIQLAKAKHGTPAIEKRKEGMQGYTRQFFEGLTFDIEVKYVWSEIKQQDFYIPQFAYQRRQDEEYQAGRTTRREEAVEKAFDEPKIDPDELPF